MLKNDLESLGLNKNEAATYLALQEKGKTKAGDLIRATGLHRNLVYVALESLAQKHLVTKSTTGRVAVFQATDPAHLLDHLREQELTAERVIEELKDKQKIVEQEITIYEGAEGMRAFNLKNAERLKPGETIHVLGSGGPKFEKAMGPKALKKYFSLIEKKQAQAKILMYQAQQFTSQMNELLSNQEVFSIKVLPQNMMPSAGVVFTKHSAAIHIYVDPISVIEIKNPHLVEAYQNYFNVLWQQEVRIEQGADAIKRNFLNIIETLHAGEEYYAIGTLGNQANVELNKFFEDYHRARVRKGIICNLLSYQDDTAAILRRFALAGDPGGKISHVRPLSRTVAGFMQTMLYANKVFIPIYGDNPSVIIFENRQLYEGFKQYFDELWEQGLIK